MATTRLGQIGVGLDSYTGFVAKIDKGVVTRLTVIGVGGAKYRTFFAKAQASAEEPPAEQPQASGAFRSRRLRLIVGKAEAVLPPIEVEVEGVHARSGKAVVSLPGIGAEGLGSVGASGDALVAIELSGASKATNVFGSAVAGFSFKAAASGAVVRVGAVEFSLQVNATASGDHDPDESEIIALSLAA